MVRGKKYQVKNVLKTGKIQTQLPPFDTVYYYEIGLENEMIVEIEYHEKKSEWYLLNRS